MKFLWLRDALVSVIFENDDIVAVDKPYGFDTHTNEAKAGQADFIQPGLIELYEKQRAEKLYIVHRLDRTTTGVIVFARSEMAAKVYQGFFRARETKKTYEFVTASKSKTSTASSREPILRNGIDLEASTDFVRRSQSGGFELWEATPHTGRNHQIRIHAAAAGLSLLGDDKYGGAEFPFICLHNRRIEFPNGIIIESKSPRYFDDLSFLNDVPLARALVEIEKRERIFQLKGADEKRIKSEPASLRLIHTAKQSSDRGLSLDQFGERLVLSWYKDQWSTSDRQTYQRLSEILKISIVVRFLKEPREPEFLGSDGASKDKWIANESGQKHEIRFNGLGLFLDQRVQRQWVKENTKDKSVLNLFSYTCGFGVAAALGGASSVTSVDLNKNVLNWGRENFALNDIDGINQGKLVFLCREAIQFLEQAKAKKQTFDLIVCDPPNFGRHDKQIFKIEVEIDRLLGLSIERLNPQGQLLFSTSSDKLFIADIRRKFEFLQKELKLKTLDLASVQPSLDFEAPGETPGLKSFLISI